MQEREQKDPWNGRRQKQGMPTDLFIHMNSAWCLASGKFKFCFQEFSGFLFTEYFQSMTFEIVVV